MPKKRMGRPRIIEPGESQNIYLPNRHRMLVKALARQNYVSFSEQVRVILEDYFTRNGGDVGASR